MEDAVAKQITKLQNLPLNTIEAATAAKRRQWVSDYLSKHGAQPITPRRAYELFLGEYLSLDLTHVPVVSETADRIVWRSANPCPTLTASRQLDQDTKHVCRAAYEKSTQAFLSALDPSLRFHRSYQTIRPHADFCEEWIMRVDFEAMMRIAIDEARQSRAAGNKGYGAVVVFDGQIVGQAYDTAVSERDPSLHAELRAIRQACKTLGDANLSGAVLFSSCEPCPMCSSLAVWANVTTIVFGASIAETLAQGKTRIAISAAEVVSKSPVMVEVIGGVLREECLALYT